MTANLIAVFGTALSGLLMLVVEWLKMSGARSTGAQIQAGKVAAVSAKAEAAIAQAEVDAPDTQAELVATLRRHDF